MEEVVKAFEKWYSYMYWDFQNHDVKYNATLNSYNHYDVDLAWNSFYAGCADRKMGELIMPDTKGIKFDDDKLDWSLLPSKEVESVIEVLMFGARKYAPDNWRKVPEGKRRYFNAAMRHLWSWFKGEKLDPESQLPHLAHAACCVIFLIGKDIEESS